MRARRPQITQSPPGLRLCLRALLSLCLFTSLTGCSSPEDIVRQARIAPDESVTVEQALTRYPYFKSVEWNTYKDKDDKRIVEAVCEIDVAANCQGVSQPGLKLARRDVARDFFLARFVVDGLPARVRALEAKHVTKCSNGALLAMADPKYLRAIYNREQVRFFCLEGLNCPGQGAAQPNPQQDSQPGRQPSPLPGQ